MNHLAEVHYPMKESVKSRLKGRNEIESFFHVVMMASDGLKHEIEFVCSPFEHNRQIGDTPPPSMIMDFLAAVH